MKASKNAEEMCCWCDEAVLATGADLIINTE